MEFNTWRLLSELFLTGAIKMRYLEDNFKGLLQLISCNIYDFDDCDGDCDDD
jgi:hypothetical protein